MSRWKALRATVRAWWRARRLAAANRAGASSCFYCGVAFTESGPEHRTVDHRLPKSRGGTDALRNMVFACYACNQRKRDRLEEDFLASEWLATRRSRDRNAPEVDRSGPENGATPSSGSG